MIIEWHQPATLRTTIGDLDLNTAGGNRYVLIQTECQVSRGLRVTSDPIPQGDGEILHRRFTDGIELAISCALWQDDSLACDSDAREMYEDLGQWLDSMFNNAGRYVWQPTDYGDERMLDEARWLVPLSTEYREGGMVVVKFGIDSPFPYFIDSTQVVENLVEGVPLVITNDGNSKFWPQIIVDGPTTAFTIVNDTTEEAIFYNGTLPGAQGILVGETGDIDTFQQKIYLNGNEDNLKAGIEPEFTDYFHIAPGANTIEMNGAPTARVLMNNAWLPQMPTPIGQRFFEAYPWRFIVTDLDSVTLTWIERLATQKSVTFGRNVPTIIEGTVPADHPEVNILADDGDAFVAEGNRLVYGFRREAPAGTGEAPWVCRAAGVILDLRDAAAEDGAPQTRFVAYDPWKYLYRRPVLTSGPSGGEQLQEDGLDYIGATANEIIIDQFEINEDVYGPFFIDYGQLGAYGGTIETTEEIESINFQRGCSLGEMLDILVATGTVDIELTPAYEKPGILCDLSIWESQGSFRPNAPFGWDMFPKNVVSIERAIDGLQRANTIQYYAGQGGPPVPEHDDTASLAKFGRYYEQRFWPGQESVAAVEWMAIIALRNLKDGLITYSCSPAAERAPIPLVEYAIGDTVPLWASSRLRQLLLLQEARVESLPLVIADDQLERVAGLVLSVEIEDS